jgi:hypothetical protein
LKNRQAFIFEIRPTGTGLNHIARHKKEGGFEDESSGHGGIEETGPR